MSEQTLATTSFMPFSGSARNYYFDERFDTPTVKVQPGEFAVCDASGLLVTAVGSCVVTCLRDPELGLGGMNHFMLPDGTDGEPLQDPAERFGALAMETLINELMQRGAQRHRLRAKIFGGASGLASTLIPHMGERNAQFLINYLSSEQIPIEAQDLLDLHPRKVYFWPGDGRVLVKRLKQAHNLTLVERERSYSMALHHRAASPGVTTWFDKGA